MKYYVMCDMHLLSVKKTSICSELRIEAWTFQSPREDSHQTITYLKRITHVLELHPVEFILSAQ